MAKRKGSRRSRGGGGRRRSAGVDGLMAGAGSRILGGSPLVQAAVIYGIGRWRGNETLETVAGFQAGQQLAAGVNTGNLLGGLGLGGNATAGTTTSGGLLG